MIYLQRGNDIAVLEDPDRLTFYKQDGWTVIDQDVHRSLWREKALLKRAEAEGTMRAAQQQAIVAAWSKCCPVCGSTQVVRPAGRPVWCQSCKARADAP